jgi:hypothetical protein
LGEAGVVYMVNSRTICPGSYRRRSAYRFDYLLLSLAGQSLHRLSEGMELACGPPEGEYKRHREENKSESSMNSKGKQDYREQEQKIGKQTMQGTVVEE